MRVSRTPLILLGVAFFTGLSILLLRPREPVYGNKPLSYWIQQLTPNTDRHGEAETAIRMIGPAKVIPCLLRKAGRADSLYRRFYYSPGRFEGFVRKWLPVPRDPGTDRIPFVLSLLGPSAVPQLVAALRDPNERVQMTVLNGLTVMGTNAAPAIPAVIQMLNPTNQLRCIAINTLHKLGPRNVEAVVALNELLKDPPSVSVASWLLGEIGPAAQIAIPELRRIVNDPGTRERDRIAADLWRISHDTNVIPVLVVELDKARDFVTRWEILRVLGQIGPPARPAIPSILKIIIDPRSDVLAEAWRALRKIDPQASLVGAAWNELLNDADPKVREKAAMVLRRLDQDTNTSLDRDSSVDGVSNPQ